MWTKHKKWPKISKNSINSSVLTWGGKSLDRSPLQKLEVMSEKRDQKDRNKTKVIYADLLDLDCDLDLDFKDIFRLCDISVLVAFFSLYFSFGDISVLVTLQIWWYFSFTTYYFVIFQQGSGQLLSNFVIFIAEKLVYEIFRHI